MKAQLVLVLFLPIILGCCCPVGRSDYGVPEEEKPPISSNDVGSDVGERAKSEASAKEDARALRESEGTVWQYQTDDEAMGRGKVQYAAVKSLNEFEFDFPYGGSQRATLTLRRHPKYGRDVILSVERGQFMTGIDGTEVSVKFDGEKPRSYHANGAEDLSTTSLFLSGFDRFLAKAKKAKKVRIEASFYQEGSRVFEFDVSNLRF